MQLSSNGPSSDPLMGMLRVPRLCGTTMPPRGHRCVAYDFTAMAINWELLMVLLLESRCCRAAVEGTGTGPP